MSPKSFARRQENDVRSVENHVALIRNASHLPEGTEHAVERVIGVIDYIGYLISPRMRLQVAKLDLASTLSSLSEVTRGSLSGPEFSWRVDQTDPKKLRYSCHVQNASVYENSPSLTARFTTGPEERLEFLVNYEPYDLSDRRMASVIHEMNEYALVELAARQAASADSST